jgi:hypothetical protein
MAKLASAKSGSLSKQALKKSKRSGFLYFFLLVAFSNNLIAFLLSISWQYVILVSSSSWANEGIAMHKKEMI